MNARLSLGCLALIALGCTEDRPLDVAKVDLKLFSGGYFEIAKFPRPTQSDCTGTRSYYRHVSDEELAVVHECHELSLAGPVRQMAARAVVTDPDEPGKLALDFGGFFGDYWIIEVPEDYRYAAVGHPSRDYLWILSRTAGMPREELDGVIRRLHDRGFDVSRLELTEQGADADMVAPDSPSSGIPELSRNGCSVGPERPTRAAGLGLLALAALGAFSRTLVRRAKHSS